MAKIDRKKLLKGPDEFITFSEGALKWAEGHVKLIVIIVSSLVLALAGGLSLKAYVDYRDNAASQALGSSFEQYLLALSSKEDSKKIEAAEAALAKVVEEYGATPAGSQARLALGNLLLEQGRWVKAESAFRVLCEDPELAPELSPLAWQGLAQSLEGQKKFGDAAEAYQDAARVAGPSLSVMFKLDQARVLAAKGDKPEAEKLYRQVMKANLTPGIQQIARAALVSLGGDPVAEEEMKNDKAASEVKETKKQD